MLILEKRTVYPDVCVRQSPVVACGLTQKKTMGVGILTHVICQMCVSVLVLLM